MSLIGEVYPEPTPLQAATLPKREGGRVVDRGLCLLDPACHGPGELTDNLLAHLPVSGGSLPAAGRFFQITRRSCRKQAGFMLSYNPMCNVAIIFAALFLLLSSRTAFGQTAPMPGNGPTRGTSPVSGTPPHGEKSRPQVVRTPPTVTQPNVVNNGDTAVGSLPTSFPARQRLPHGRGRPFPLRPAYAAQDGRAPGRRLLENGDPCQRLLSAGRDGPIAPADQTEAWLCADSTHLYLAFHCLDSHPELIHASQIQRNGSIGEDDFVGVDIDSQNNRHGCPRFGDAARDAD